jgi:hypothetical protein
MRGETTIHIEGVPVDSILDALLAIEKADMAGAYDKAQHNRLGPLVLGLRAAMDAALEAQR